MSTLDVAAVGGLAAGTVEPLEVRRIQPVPAAENDNARPIAHALTTVPVDWLEVAPPTRCWLLEQDDPETDGETTRGWLPLGKVGMLAAGGGVGKTMALVQLAVAIATGRDWYGLHVASPGRVFLALAEEDAEEVRRRIYGAVRLATLSERERQLVAERIVVAPLAGNPVALLERDANGNAAETPVLGDLRRVLEDGGEWRLVVLDPLSRWAGLDAENDNAQATRFVAAVETVVRAPGGPTVLLAHHTSKGARREGDREATAARGASALVDGVRWCATMLPVNVGALRTVEIALVKSNYSHTGETIRLVREEDGTLRPLRKGEAEEQQTKARKATDDRLRARVLDAIRTEGPITARTLRAAVGGRAKDVDEVRKELEDAGLIRRGVSGYQPVEDAE